MKTTYKQIIVVSGLPRSGTSLMMKMLEAAGFELVVDHVREADEDNPRGYYELEAVKQMKEGGADWVKDASGKAVKVVAPLMQYLPHDRAYKVLFMRRAMPEILASQKQMLIRRGQDPDAVPDEMMAQIFEKQLMDVLKWMESSKHIEFVEIAYADLIAGEDEPLHQIQSLLGADTDLDAMRAMIDPKLYRQRA